MINYINKEELEKHCGGKISASVSTSSSEREDEVYEENMAGVTDEINKLKLNPELQNMVDKEQGKVYDKDDDEKIIVNFDSEGKPTIKSIRGGLQQGNVNITWEADQKCIKPKVTVNELATHDEIVEAVNNAKTAFYMSCQLITESGDIAAPMPLPEPKPEKEKK